MHGMLCLCLAACTAACFAAGCSGHPMFNPALGVFSCALFTPSGGNCNATCLYGTVPGPAAPVATCTDGVWTVTDGVCANAPVVPNFVTSSSNWTWFLTSSCSTDVTDALLHALLADLQALLVKTNSTGVMSVAQASCSVDVVSPLWL